VRVRPCTPWHVYEHFTKHAACRMSGTNRLVVPLTAIWRQPCLVPSMHNLALCGCAWQAWTIALIMLRAPGTDLQVLGQ